MDGRKVVRPAPQRACQVQLPRWANARPSLPGRGIVSSRKAAAKRVSIRKEVGKDSARGNMLRFAAKEMGRRFVGAASAAAVVQKQVNRARAIHSTAHRRTDPVLEAWRQQGSRGKRAGSGARLTARAAVESPEERQPRSPVQLRRLARRTAAQSQQTVVQRNRQNRGPAG